MRKPRAHSMLAEGVQGSPWSISDIQDDRQLRRPNSLEVGRATVDMPIESHHEQVTHPFLPEPRRDEVSELREFCQGRFEYLDSLLRERISEFRQDNTDIHERVGEEQPEVTDKLNKMRPSRTQSSRGSHTFVNGKRLWSNRCRSN